MSHAKRRPTASRAHERSDDAHAFIPDPSEGGAPPTEDLAEVLGEDFVESATRGNEVLEDDLDVTLPEEIGGPFVVTRERAQYDSTSTDSPASRPARSAGTRTSPSAKTTLDSAAEPPTRGSAKGSPPAPARSTKRTRK